jgi:hypothetical protein
MIWTAFDKFRAVLGSQWNEDRALTFSKQVKTKKLKLTRVGPFVVVVVLVDAGVSPERLVAREAGERRREVAEDAGGAEVAAVDLGHGGAGALKGGLGFFHRLLELLEGGGGRGQAGREAVAAGRPVAARRRRHGAAAHRPALGANLRLDVELRGGRRRGHPLQVQRALVRARTLVHAEHLSCNTHQKMDSIKTCNYLY